MAHGPRKKPLDFGGNPDHVTKGSGLWLGEGRCVLPGICLIVTVLRHQWPW